MLIKEAEVSLSTIKSYPNGISLHLDPGADFDDVLKDVETKFEESRKFFKNAKVALSIEDRIVSDEEERLVVKAINEHSDLELLCIVGRNPETNRKYVKALKRVESQRDDNNARFYRGNVQEGEIVECEGTLVVFGDVCKGAAAVAKDNVIVIGSVYGQVYAGKGGEKNRFIVAMNLEPEILSIAGIKQGVKVKGSFGRKVKYNPTMIMLENDKMVSKSVSDDIIKEILK